MMFDKKQAGFNLMELLVTVTILGILSAIAFPTYAKYVARGKRITATTTLMEMAAKLERNYNLSYDYTKKKGKTDEVYEVGVPQNSNPDGKNYFGGLELPENYEVNIAEISRNGFVLTATAIGNQRTSDPLCTMFAIDNNGTKRAWKDKEVPTTSNWAKTIRTSADKSNKDCW